MLHRFRRITPDTWFALGLEFFAIVLGVMFALGMDEWREDREISRNTDIAVERLSEEILFNRAELRENLNFLEDNYERLAALTPANDRPFREYMREFGGYAFPSLKDSVWQRVSRDRLANYISASYIEEAFQLYNRNALLHSVETEIHHLTSGENFHDAARAKIAHGISKHLMLQQIIWTREALALYDDFIQRHIPDVN